MSGDVRPTGRVDAAGLRELFEAGAAALAAAADAINAINVYPVPDGDTGSNMAATMREAAAAAREVRAERASEVAAAAARGALYGARGNSGVILSQALRGFADALRDCGEIDAALLAQGLRAAAGAAYDAVSRPQEGTMLTVLRAAAEGAAAAAARLPGEGRGAVCLPVLEQALAAAELAEARTQEMLPSLREAGVPDAGGEGICVLLEGMAARLRGEDVDLSLLAEGGQAREFAAAHAEDVRGYCTEFVLEPAFGEGVDIARLRALAERFGSSVVVVGDAQLARVHVHTEEPEALLRAAGELGTPGRVKVDDMGAQRAQFERAGSGATASVGLLALSRGDGFDRVFESLGARVLDLGTREKPAAGEIAAAAEATGAPDVVVLPNHKNVLLAAEQAAQLARCTLHIVPTTTLPQGVAAALMFDPAGRAAELVSRMAEAAKSVRTVEVTRAAASRAADGVRVEAGQAIAVVDGRLKAARATLEDALVEGLAAAGAGAGKLVTVYVGEGGEAGLAGDAVRQRFPGAEVEVIDGGQPLYPYIASVES
ncbi:MAG: kinase [Tepidiforma sp.]|nr:MAG: kinase [Tepidiforma sp.]